MAGYYADPGMYHHPQFASHPAVFPTPPAPRVQGKLQRCASESWQHLPKRPIDSQTNAYDSRPMVALYIRQDPKEALVVLEGKEKSKTLYALLDRFD
jgi:hypothetical protein